MEDIGIQEGTIGRLVGEISGRTGTKFSVTQKVGDRHRFHLNASRDGHKYVFFAGGLQRGKMVHYLAAMLDLIDMGFIPLKDNANV